MQFDIHSICHREYRIKRVVFGILRNSAITELLLFCANAPDNFLEREQGMKRGVRGFPSMVTESGKSQRLRSYMKL